MDFGEFGWRDLIWLVVVLAAIYLGLSLRGLAQLRRRRAPASAAASSHGGEAQILAVPSEPSIGGTRSAPTESVAAPAIDFEAELSARLRKTELETEVRQLRRELAVLRVEMAELKASRRVSPLYAEAAALAQRGFDARGVAVECGISVAEAELVLAMTRDNQNFDREVDDGAGGK